LISEQREGSRSISQESLGGRTVVGPYSTSSTRGGWATLSGSPRKSNMAPLDHCRDRLHTSKLYAGQGDRFALVYNPYLCPLPLLPRQNLLRGSAVQGWRFLNFQGLSVRSDCAFISRIVRTFNIRATSSVCVRRCSLGRQLDSSPFVYDERQRSDFRKLR
jgi:hypothetical protein